MSSSIAPKKLNHFMAILHVMCFAVMLVKSYALKKLVSRKLAFSVINIALKKVLKLSSNKLTASMMMDLIYLD